MNTLLLTQLTAVTVMATSLVTAGRATSDCPNRATLLTFNAGLTPTVYGFDQRRAAVVSALVGQSDNADFMCLQEMW